MFILSSPSLSIPYNPILSLSLSLSSHIFSSLLIFSIYHPPPSTSSFLFFFFLSFFFPSRITEKEENIFSLKPNCDFSTVARKKKGELETSNIPSIIFHNIPAPHIFPREGERNGVESVSRSDRRKKFLEGRTTAK